MASSVLTFVLVGQNDHPIYEVDLTGPKEVSPLAFLAGPGLRRGHAASLLRLPRGARTRCSPQQQLQYLHQFVLHAALDAVDEAMWTTKELHLKVRWHARHNAIDHALGSTVPARSSFVLLHHHLQTVDRFNALSVTAFVTPGNARLLMLHDGKSDDSIKTFFTEVYELYLRVRALGSLVLGPQAASDAPYARGAPALAPSARHPVPPTRALAPRDGVPARQPNLLPRRRHHIGLTMWVRAHALPWGAGDAQPAAHALGAHHQQGV